MTDINLLRQIAGKINPSRITGRMNLTAYPSPSEVMMVELYPDKKERMEILMPFRQEGAPLHSNPITSDGKVHDLRVLAGKLETPENCFVCNRPAVAKGVLEARSNPKLGYGSKTTIDSPISDRLWISIKCDRYWFTFPVCENHKDGFHKLISIDAARNDGNIEIKLPHISWGRQFVDRNAVTCAVVKSEEYLRKYRWAAILLFLGILGSAIAITLTVVQGDWGCLLPTVPVMLVGFYLLLKNPFEVLVSDTRPDIGKGKFHWPEGIISQRAFAADVNAFGFVILLLGLGSFILSVNGNYLPLPWFLKAGIAAVGGLIAFLGFYWKSRIEKGK